MEGQGDRRTGRETLTKSTLPVMATGPTKTIKCTLGKGIAQLDGNRKYRLTRKNTIKCILEKEVLGITDLLYKGYWLTLWQTNTDSQEERKSM